MKLTLTQTGNTVNYDLSKSGIVGSGHVYGCLTFLGRHGAEPPAPPARRFLSPLRGS